MRLLLQIVLALVVVIAVMASDREFVPPTVAVLAAVFLVGTWRGSPHAPAVEPAQAEPAPVSPPGAVAQGAGRLARAAGRQVASLRPKDAPAKPGLSLDDALARVTEDSQVTSSR